MKTRDIELRTFNKKPKPYFSHNSFEPICELFKTAVQKYISEYTKSQAKNTTLFFFWKDSGIDRAKHMLVQFKNCKTITDLFNIILAEEGQGIDLSKYLYDCMMTAFKIDKSYIDGVAARHIYAGYIGGINPRCIIIDYIPEEGIHHFETQARAKKEIALNIIHAYFKQSRVRSYQTM